MAAARPLKSESTQGNTPRSTTDAAALEAASLSPVVKRPYIGIFSLFIILLVSIGIAFVLQSEMPDIEAERTLTSNLGFFLLINLNIIVVMILGFLVAKNVLKLLLDRRRNILGAKLRSRLVAAFVGLSMIPTILLFLVAKGMLERGLQEWFSPQIVAAVDGALGVARSTYDVSEAQVYRQVRHLGGSFLELSPYLIAPSDFRQSLESKDTQAILLQYLDSKRREYGVFSVQIVDARGRVVLSSNSLELRNRVVELPSPNRANVHKALDGSVLVVPEQSINGEFLRGYGPLQYSFHEAVESSTGVLSSIGGIRGSQTHELQDQSSTYALLVTQWIPPSLSSALGTVVNAHDDYKELKSYRRPIASSYFLTLVVVTLLIIFGAVWVGFYLARDLSVPIGMLAEGTQQVADGNLDHRIPEVGDDELSVLVRSFNTMTEDLKEKTGELERRRQYIETILESVGVGVISLDPHASVTTLNRAAAEMLALHSVEEQLPKALGSFLPSSATFEIDRLLDQLHQSPEGFITANIMLERGSEAKHLQVSLTKLVDTRGGEIGSVMLLDDVTELISAQRMAAWREVARRIAHEIKNPLTPIQLSAERMQRKFSTHTSEHKNGDLSKDAAEFIGESTETIINQVENLRRLVNEFSRFARMPKSDPRPAEVNQVIRETAAMYRDAHPNIQFRIELDPLTPRFSLDREQIGRVMINLIDNGIASIREQSMHQNETLSPAKRAFRSVGSLLQSHSATTPEHLGEISIESEFNQELEMVSIVVSDSGMGIPDSDKPKLFEPYFSTKGGGTGLGLTIVGAIIADHHGYIRVKDKEPHGARFIIELPVSRTASERAENAKKLANARS